MTNQSHAPTPDPWAQHRRIAAEWQEMGRGVDRRTQVARMESVRASRAKALSEARIRGAVDRAVREVLRAPEFGETVTQLTGGTLSSDAPEPPAKPLHEMDPEEWRAHAARFGPQAFARQPRRPMSIGELVAGRYEGDSEA